MYIFTRGVSRKSYLAGEPHEVSSNDAFVDGEAVGLRGVHGVHGLP